MSATNAPAGIREVLPAIVDINTFRNTFSPDGTGGIHLTPLGAGTGMVLTSSGEVLTNNHVVEGAEEIRVVVAGHQDPYTATVVGVDQTDDVALLQLRDASGLPTVTVGDAASLETGQPVTAIGNALGRGGAPTVTTGTITGLHRSITANGGLEPEHLSDLIKTDAMIQPGDSGGALVDTQGHVVGMITAGARNPQGQAVPSLGYAIPIDGALGIVTQIRAGQGFPTILVGERGFLGVSVKELDQATASSLGIRDTSGALVVGLQPDSPAVHAGFTVPAVIRAVDGQTIGSIHDLGPLLHVHTPGDRVEVTWIDGNGTHTETVELIAGPAV